MQDGMGITESNASTFSQTVSLGDGSTFDLIMVLPSSQPRELIYWVPAMGIAARHYLPLAESLAGEGVAVAIHEWRGIGSSSLRADRHHDWRYRDLLEVDFPAGLEAARAHAPQARLWFGGHSLGGQLASLYAGLHRHAFHGVALVASGAPYWRQFRFAGLVRFAYIAAPWLAKLVGHLPGRRIGFGGNEARGVIDDWARSGRTGRYAASGLAVDLEMAMHDVRVPILALRMRDDWLGPAASLHWLLGKMPMAPYEMVELDAAQLGTRADHFSWMKSPVAVSARLAQWIHRH
ncbi:alpha/beta hydrolase family protein [Dyella terrae]|nr:alpha/beta fold hydrolase [Dyella terrae]